VSNPQIANIHPGELMRIKPFRLLWTNSFLFVLVQSTQRFAFVWLALELGARSDINGVILFVMGIPALLISLPVGVMSDHLNRKTLLLVSQLGALATTIAIAFMVSANMMTISWAIGASFAAGIFIALGTPVRAAVIPTLVPQDKLIGAIAVNTIGMNIGLILGPATAGPVIRIWGIQGAFWLQALLYFLGFIALLRLQLPAGVNHERKSLRWEILEGIKFIHSHQAVRSFFVLLSSSTVFMMAPWIVLGPQLAKEEAGATATQTTIMFALLGVGQFVTSLFILRFNQLLVRKGLWFMLGLCWGSAVQILLGQSTSIVMMSVFLFMWGVGGGLYMNLNQTLIQNNTPREVMGRVMAIHSLLMSGLAPAGALLVGLIARQVDSAPLVFSACGAAMMASTLYFLTAKPHLRPMA
jgi:MFS family permease